VAKFYDENQELYDSRAFSKTLDLLLRVAGKVTNANQMRNNYTIKAFISALAE